MTRVDPSKFNISADSESRNEDRANWAEYAVVAFQSVTGVDDLNALIDLLADLMHWADRNDRDFEAAYAMARKHYEAETASDSQAKLTPFDDYEIHGVREFGRGKQRFCEQVPDAEAQFWSLYGHIPGQGLECIGDFDSRSFAEEVLARIRGRTG
ncbi:hypothetical protein [Bremerella cremea]|uniref:hypothetical protein n=1 Tax=Bremerella cremea TaxID=1031537 RepID=UPI0031EA7E06